MLFVLYDFPTKSTIFLHSFPLVIKKFVLSHFLYELLELFRFLFNATLVSAINRESL